MFASIDRHGKCGLCSFLGLFENCSKICGEIRLKMENNVFRGI